MADRSAPTGSGRKGRENFRRREPEEWKNLLMERMENLFRYRMQHKSGQLKQTHLLKRTRREIAQLITLMKEKQLKEEKDG